MIGNSNHETNFLHRLLTNTINGFLGGLLGLLIKVALPLMKNVFHPLA